MNKKNETKMMDVIILLGFLAIGLIPGFYFGYTYTAKPVKYIATCNPEICNKAGENNVIYFIDNINETKNDNENGNNKYPELPYIDPYKDIKGQFYLLGPNRYFYMSCKSHSMMPTFNCSDTLVAIIPSDKENLLINDIIWFYNPDVYKYNLNDDVVAIVHRITDVKKQISTECDSYDRCYTYNTTLYKTQGDDNPYEDPWLVESRKVKFLIIGKVKM